MHSDAVPWDLFDGDFDASVHRREFKGVRKEVEPDLMEGTPISHQLGKVLIDLDCQGDAFFIEWRLDQAHRVAQGRSQRQRLFAKLATACFDAR